MAIVTKRLARLENGECLWALDWDDISGELLIIRCTNNSRYDSEATFIPKRDTTRPFTLICSKQSTIEHFISGGIKTRFGTMEKDVKGRLDSIDFNFRMMPTVREI